MIGGIGGPFRRVNAIARNTFLEAARNRAFLGLGIAAMGLVVASLALANLAISDQKARVLTDFGLFAIALLLVVIAVTMGVILVFQEVDRKTFYVVLTKPIRRYEVLAGKLLGLYGVLAIALVGMSAAWLVALRIQGVPLLPDMAPALVLVWMQAAVLTSVALFFSAFATPLMSGVFTVGFYLIGSSLTVLQDHLSARKGALVTDPTARALARAAVFLLPDLSHFHVGKELVLGIPVGWDYVAAAGGYALGWVLLFFSLAVLVFERRDFT